jgi:predicted RNase H-like HicB family nuclease
MFSTAKQMIDDVIQVVIQDLQKNNLIPQLCLVL